MKLIIQVPCFNEAESLPAALAELPREVAGFDSVEWLIVDDGSADNTAEVALEHGVDHVVRLPYNRGLAKAFMAGLDACIQKGADVIVNTDADNQYCGADIPGLVEPILQRNADMVIGARSIDDIDEFSSSKKFLQKLGSRVVRSLSGTSVQDAPSGFRAMTRDLARRLNVFSNYTYTLETIIQAGQNGMRIVSVPVRTNESIRPSRLVKSIPSYIKRSVLTMFRIFIVYRPMRFFLTLGIITGSIGFLIGLRFLYYFVMGEGQGHVQSVILSALLLGSGLLLFVLALLADLISVNRRLLEQISWRVGELEERDRRRKESDAV